MSIVYPVCQKCFRIMTASERMSIFGRIELVETSGPVVCGPCQTGKPDEKGWYAHKDGVS